MASKMAARRSSLGQSILEHLECSICFGYYRDPRMLECLHNFCLRCLQELRQQQNTNNGKLTCPLCRRETTLKENRTASLPSNLTLNALVEMVALQDELWGSQGSEIKCQACDENNRAVSRCEDCQYYLCQECQRAHERLAMMKSHKICTLAQLKSVISSEQITTGEGIAQCGKHLDPDACLYCNTCEELVCTNCSVLEHENTEHQLVGISEASDTFKKDAVDLVARAEESLKALSLAFAETEESCKKLDASYTNTKQKISARANAEVARIREEERKMKQDVRRIYEERGEKIAEASNGQALAKARHKLDEAKELLATENHQEILELKQKLTHNLNEVAERQPEKMPDLFTFMDFENGQDSALGRLVLRDPEVELDGMEALQLLGKWELKTELKQIEFGFAYDVATFSNNEIAVADIERNQIAFVLPRQSNELNPTTSPRQEITALYYPSHISVTRNDLLVVLDGLSVKIINQEDKLLHEFMPGRSSNSTPTCLAVDDTGELIAVGYEAKEEISLHSVDGELIQTLPAPMIGDYLIIFNRRFIYTNHGQKRLVAVNFDGVLVFSEDVDLTKQGKNLGPSSVCCDKNGIIYVAVLTPWSGDIHCFSPDGNHIGCVVKGCGPTLGLTFTAQGELVLASEHAVQIYHSM
ncbi:uncharacterized protein LOC110985291 [Acanthaster planci]|uniref:Uncharacterized protein LOC110985291 n=1 Tax=Acanthaster planci TaxID=133434 RepID=A0A8B7ZAB8_ACAPL|nr:uncharacterized protein LOC110985291 [Acanthaster planci]